MARTLIAAAITLFAIGSPLAASEEPGKGAIERARAAYEQRADGARARAAVDLFAEAAKADPGSYEARWEGARACYFYGTFTREEGNDEEKMKIFDDGVRRAREAVVLRADGVEGHFWLGVLLSVYGEAKGIFKSLALVPEIRAEMERCVAADPAVEGWGPDRVLGRILFKLPFFKGGDNEKSREHLERSLAGAPTNALTRLYLAETYKALGMKAKAVEQLKVVVEMTPDPRWAPEHPSVVAKAGNLLRKLS
jgi:tetratricopeptide (TPR) repeat protein